MFQIKYNTQENILNVAFTGKIDILTMLNCFRSLGEQAIPNKDLYILMDFLGAEFIFKPSEISLISTETANLVSDYHTVRIAAVYATPKEIAYGQLIQHYSVIKNYYHQIFQSTDNAYQWLRPSVLVVQNNN